MKNKGKDTSERCRKRRSSLRGVKQGAACVPKTEEEKREKKRENLGLWWQREKKSEGTETAEADVSGQLESSAKERPVRQCKEGAGSTRQCLPSKRDTALSATR